LLREIPTVHVTEAPVQNNPASVPDSLADTIYFDNAATSFPKPESVYLAIRGRESARQPHGNITSLNDAFAVSRMREIRLSGSMWRGPETERWTILNGHEAGNGGYSQGPSCTPPRRSSTRPSPGESS
jgi:hypothetical protein